MFLNFNRKSFGLDISENSVRLAQTVKFGNKHKVVSWAEASLPAGLIQKGVIIKKDEVAAVFKKLIKNVRGRRLASKFTVACLPEPKTFIKVIKVPYHKSKDILNDIVEEAEKHIPFDLADAYFDWQYLDESDRDRVLIGVCLKDIVNNYQETLRLAGLVPLVLEVEPVAIARSLFPIGVRIEEPAMVIDFGAVRTGLFVYEEDYIPFSLSLDISSDGLTDFIKDSLKITLGEAETAKRSLGLLGQKANGALLRLLSPHFEEVAKHIRQAKIFYEEKFFGKNLNKVYLSGGGSNLPGLVDFLKAKTGLQVSQASLSPNLEVVRHLNLPPDKIQGFTTAIGLSLRH